MENVGEKFSVENFQQALKEGEVSSITVFAKCHHSNFYYPTKIGKMHPHLKFDLLGSMISAAHEIGVKTPVYFSVGWSAQDLKEHPEWQTKAFGKDEPNNLNYDIHAKPEDPKPFVSWINVCINNPEYQKLVFAEVEELCANYPIDGLYLDIMFNDSECDCPSCREGMKKLGYNPDVLEDSRNYLIFKRREFQKHITEIVRKYHSAAEIFFNGCDMYMPQYHEFDTHFELEDNPQVWGGYDKMPVRAKYFARKGKPYIAQSGKFHTSWGEYAGFKNPLSLKYECAAMLAFGARCELGDQMHPSGEMDMQTYKNVGVAYRYVKQIEKYCLDNSETTTLGIFLSGDSVVDEGLTKMLFESHLDFDIVLDGEETDRFDVLIIPPRTRLSARSIEKVNRHIACGKGLLLIGDGSVENGNFAINAGIEYCGKSEYDYDYVKVQSAFSDFAVQSPFLFYSTAHKVKVPENAEILATVKEPFFSRTYAHYCSHQNTPYKYEDASYPAIARLGNIVYVSHNTPEIYYEYGCQYHRDITVRALKEIYKNPVMRVDGLLSAGRCHFVKNTCERRYVFHVLYACPIQRGKVAVLEDFPRLDNIKVDLGIEEKVLDVKLIPQDKKVDFIQENGRVRFVIDSFSMHQMVVINY